MRQLNDGARRQFTIDLLNWYEVNKRNLPWRKSKDPYKIWVSEIMLQQTQVATVIPYFERFITAFPNIRALSKAPIDDVLKLWEGLGYYSRARNLHRAAQDVISDWGGQLPESSIELLKLPGIGSYTSAAIASIAFDEDVPVLDGNVRREMSRILLIKSDSKSPKIERQIVSELRHLLPMGEAGDFNQALMELGALICTPSNPKCDRCPVKNHCGAFEKNLQDKLPLRTPRKARPHHDVAVGVIWKGKKLLISQRPEKGLLGGLWEFPGGKREGDETLEECLHRELMEELAIEVKVISKLSPVEHGYTHFKVTLHPYICELSKGIPKTIGCSALAWILPDKISDYAFPRANHKIFEMLFESNN
jgi:A/G-specific adenine glycosylase